MLNYRSIVHRIGILTTFSCSPGFVGEQYTMKTIEKERHHHVEGHGHGHHGHHHPHFHSGASSTGGSSIHQNVEENREPKSKWNCFKSNN